MEPDRIVLILASLFFLGGFGYAAYTLGAGKTRNSRFNMAAIMAGFALQNVFLYLRGQQVGRCPITNVFEILIFVSWATVLLYFLVGPTYRLSLLGVFTAPLAFVFQLAALVLPSGFEKPVKLDGEADFWLEIHASVSLLAYGAFALACVAGLMFIIQDRLLKRHTLNTLFYNLPPINHLAKATLRLLVLGFVLLTFGIASAYGMEKDPSGLKLSMSYSVWALYGVLLAVTFFRGLSPNRVAQAAVGVFAVPIFTLWIVSS